MRLVSGSLPLRGTHVYPSQLLMFCALEASRSHILSHIAVVRAHRGFGHRSAEEIPDGNEAEGEAAERN